MNDTAPTSGKDELFRVSSGFANFLRYSRDGKPAKYTMTDTDQTFYNQQAVDILLAQANQQAVQKAREIDYREFVGMATHHETEFRQLREHSEHRLATLTDAQPRKGKK